MGSGTDAIACYDLGFNYVGCEIDELYHLESKKLVTNHIKKYSSKDEFPFTSESQIKLF